MQAQRLDIALILRRRADQFVRLQHVRATHIRHGNVFLATSAYVRKAHSGVQRVSNILKTPVHRRCARVAVDTRSCRTREHGMLKCVSAELDKISGISMGRTNLKSAYIARDHRRRAGSIRRIAWKQRSAPAPRTSTRQFSSTFASGEFELARPLSSAWIVWRSFGLACDIIVLTLASPFLAIWWAWRTARRLFGADN